MAGLDQCRASGTVTSRHRPPGAAATRSESTPQRADRAASQRQPQPNFTHYSSSHTTAKDASSASRPCRSSAGTANGVHSPSPTPTGAASSKRRAVKYSQPRGTRHRQAKTCPREMGSPGASRAERPQIGYGWNRSNAEITGRAGSAVARVIVKLRNGEIRTFEPVKGYIFGALPLPSSAASNLNPVRSISAYAANGRVLTPPTVSLAGGSGTIIRLTHTSIRIGSPRAAHTCRVTQQ
jgi:hypothetical protein